MENRIISQAMIKAPGLRKIPFFSLFLRSFLFGTLMNLSRMLGLSFGLAMIPIARKLKLRGESLSKFLNRNLEFFNTHPYMAPYVLGAVSRLEVEGEEDTKIKELKSRIMGHLAVFGDQIFWSRYKPLLIMFAVLLLFFIQWPPTYWYRKEYICCLCGLFLIYNIGHIIVRWQGLIQGFRSGGEVLRVITSSKWVKYRLHMSLLAAFMAGFLLVKVGHLIGSKESYLAAFLGALFCLRLKSPLWVVILFASVLSLGLSLYLGLSLNE